MSETSRDRDVESYNRLFILGGKGCSEDTFRREFGRFGHITDVYIMKEKGTGEDRGIVYITFEKISEAALAVEEMNGKTIPGNSKSLKVLIANSKSKGSSRDPQDDEKLFRLFIMVPKDYSEDSIRSIFEQYGKVDYVRLLKDKHTGDSKGLAYVKYFKQYDAAIAYENCDAAFKPIFATNQGNKSKSESRSSSDRRGSYEPEQFKVPFYPPYPTLNNYAPRYTFPISPQNECDLQVQFTVGLTQEQVRAVCDLVPGLDYCQYDRQTGMTYARYMTPVSAAHAKLKLEKLEYPPGYPVMTQFGSEMNRSSHGNIGIGASSSTSNNSNILDMIQNMQRLTELSTREGSQSELMLLAQNIQKAAEMLQQAGFNASSSRGSGAPSTGGTLERPHYCNVPLPYPQPLAAKDAPMVERLFLVSQPEQFHESYLTDLLCRFGNLIDAYFLPGKNYGYAKFASKESANNAMETLHGSEVCGNRLKLAHAEPPKNDRSENGSERKRPRHD